MDLACGLLFVSSAPFFCHNCHLLPPAATSCRQQHLGAENKGHASMGHQQGEGSSAGKSSEF